MKEKLKALLLYAFFWLVFFFAARLIFLLGNFSNSSELGLRVLSGTFGHGILLDISATAYILSIPMLVLLPSIWIRGEWFRYFMKAYTWIILLICAPIVTGKQIGRAHV